MSFRLVPNSVTLDDLEQRNSANGHLISRNSVAFGADYAKVVEDTPVLFVRITPTARVGPGHSSSPLFIYFLIFPPFLLFSFFHWLYLFSSFSIPSLSTRIVPLRFQAGGRRRRPNLGLVCVSLCNLCYLYSLVKMDCGVLFSI